MSTSDAAPLSHPLRTARVLRVSEDACETWSGGEAATVRFAPMFPTPRIERVSPGHLVAVATGPDGDPAVVWRWFDAVVLGHDPEGSVRLWEPAHGEVLARTRPSFVPLHPGSRAFASAGLPGADWWVVASTDADSPDVGVDLVEVDRLYSENDLWQAVFPPNVEG